MSFTDIKTFTIELFSNLPVKMLVDAIKILLNKVDKQENKITELASEIQKLRDENNRLKGEKGKPVTPKNKDDKKDDKDKKNGDSNGGRGKNKKPKEIEVHKTENLDIDKNELPKDAQYKGTRDTLVLFAFTIKNWNDFPRKSNSKTQTTSIYDNYSRNPTTSFLIFQSPT